MATTTSVATTMTTLGCSYLMISACRLLNCAISIRVCFSMSLHSIESQIISTVPPLVGLTWSAQWSSLSHLNGAQSSIWLPHFGRLLSWAKIKWCASANDHIQSLMVSLTCWLQNCRPFRWWRRWRRMQREQRKSLMKNSTSNFEKINTKIRRVELFRKLHQQRRHLCGRISCFAGRIFPCENNNNRHLKWQTILKLLPIL